jgi:hypothetical protein
MSVTISRCLSPESVKIQTHKQDLAIITIVFNPENNRLTTNMNNVSADDSISMLAASMGVLTNLNAGPLITAGKLDNMSLQAIGV